MIRRFLITLLLVCASVVQTRTHATEPAPALPATSPRFVFVDLYLDAQSESLAAYQLEFSSTDGHASVVGIEAGEADAFARTPPYYDPVAIGKDRAILAAYSTDNALPHGRTRVARVHLMIESAEPRYAIKLIVAANPAGKAIPAIASFVEGATP